MLVEVAGRVDYALLLNVPRVLVLWAQRNLDKRAPADFTSCWRSVCTQGVCYAIRILLAGALRGAFFLARSFLSASCFLDSAFFSILVL